MPLLRSKRKLAEPEEIDNSAKKKKTPRKSNGKVKNCSVKVEPLKLPLKPEKDKEEPVAVAGVSNGHVEEGSGDSSSECDWEEVEELKEPVIPKEGVTITIDAPTKRNKKKFDIHAEIIRRINRFQQDTQLCMHKVHLLCLMAYGLQLNCYVNMDLIRAIALSLLPKKLITIKNERNVSTVNKLLEWFNDNFTLIKDENFACTDLTLERLQKTLESRKLSYQSDYVCVFLVYLRQWGFNSRLILSLRPLMRKLSADKLMKKPRPDKDPSKDQVAAPKIVKVPVKRSPSTKKTKTVQVKSEDSSTYNNRRSKRVRNLKKVDYSEETEIEENKQVKQPSLAKESAKKIKEIKIESESDVEDEFEERSLRRKRSKSAVKSNNSSGSEVWIEVYVEEERRWISVDCISHLVVDQPYNFERACGKPFEYVLGFDNSGQVVDLTRRYAEGCLRPEHRKRRVDPEWWDETLEAFRDPNNEMLNLEMRQLDDVLLQRPLPTTLTEYKGHPFYVLQKHLLKFEGLYPPDAVPVGYFRKDPVYSRDCVHTLHARETWFREARLVKQFETPYKIVKARPKWIRATREVIKDKPLELFGKWQTEDYVPQVASNGIVPRNEHGNVDLLKPCMLPIGTVHLQLPGLIRVARKLKIDCGAAFVGWEFSGGSNHPIFDGWVVCEEFKDVLVDAWHEEQEASKEREQVKKDKRVYGNWKRLIKGLLIAERLKAKYLTKT